MVLLKAPGTLRIVAGKMFDSHTRTFWENQLITVVKDSGIIIDVRALTADTVSQLDYADPDLIDLRKLTVLPGFVDAHVHFFLHPYTEKSWDDQLNTESLTERVIRATVHAKRTLMAGFTTVRDLGTEGAQDADIALRKCISGTKPLIPGPRYFTANRAIVATGTYGPKSSLFPHQEGVDGIQGCQVADGTDECIKAVRRQVGAGADWIKVYAEYAARSRIEDVAPIIGNQFQTLFRDAEFEAMVSEAHRLGAKVAVHSLNSASLLKLLDLGVDSVEHGWAMPVPLPRNYTKTTWVPTLSMFYIARGHLWNRARDAFQTALAHGVDNFACGGDTGTFAHGDNALELVLMVKLGADVCAVLNWATLGGWKCVRSLAWEGKDGEARIARIPECAEDARVVGDNDVPFGAIRRGYTADIIATTGDITTAGGFEQAVNKDSITFVMKGGRIYKYNGLEVSI
ncbi:hypothetical protein FB451DRAFT_65783 [Mycena latifolia]|nr:hypothetical protein FB451DRAFT_65783 [Mycena latifolia]